MGTTSRTFTVRVQTGTSSELEFYASNLAAGQSVEFNSNALNVFANNGGEVFVYWNHKFHWDETNREAQIIGIGTGFSNLRHAWFTDTDSQWSATAAFDPVSLWPVNNLGHPYQWHTIDASGNYWLKRSTENAFQYRKRADRTTSSWAGADRTPDFVGSFASWPQSLEWHHAMGKALLRNGSTVMSFDFTEFLSSGVWNYETLPIAPAITRSGDRCAMHYCHALQSMICFGINEGTTQDAQHLIRSDGSMETMANKPPRYVLNGNVLVGSSDIEKFCLFVDDPLKQSAYLLERQPSGSLLPNRVWKMRNTGTAWDGTWDEVGTTDVFTKPRADLQTIGTRPAVCAIQNYGVVWVLRQYNTRRIDSFLWKPPV